MELGSRIKAAREKLGLTQEELAERVGMKQTGIGSIEAGDVERPRKLLEISRALNVAPELLLGSKLPSFALRDGIQPNASQPFDPPELPQRQIPVYGVAIGGDDGRMKFNGERLDMVGSPPELRHVSNAYAVYVNGDSMVPSFKPGQIAWVNPHLTARAGDDVIVQIQPEHEGDAPEGFIKELVKRTPSKVVVKQYNPERTIEFDKDEVVSIHVVVFSSRR